MGLDMWLLRAPRFKETTPDEINALEKYFRIEELEREGKADELNQWDRVDEIPSLDLREFYRPHYKTRYYLWDEEKRFPHKYILEEVAYWRKSNQIHNWFVQNVQDGYDDCQFHREVTEEDLISLLETCRYILKSVKTMSDGEIVVPKSAKELLPTQGGFFFGGTEYDEWYVRDIEDTQRMLEEVLNETDFEKQMIYYLSSW